MLAGHPRLKTMDLREDMGGGGGGEGDGDLLEEEYRRNPKSL